MRRTIICYGVRIEDKTVSAHPGLTISWCESYAGVCKDCFEMLRGRLSFASPDACALSLTQPGKLSLR